MDAARRTESVYRWRGDGLTREAGSIDYLHGSVTGEWRATGDDGGQERDGQRLTADSRLLHWDLFENADVHSRTA